MFPRSSHLPRSFFIGLCALALVLIVGCSASDGDPMPSGPSASGDAPPPVVCPADTPGCVSWDAFDGPVGPIVRSSSGLDWVTTGLNCSDCRPAFRTDGSRATMAPGSEKNSIWLATIDGGRATGVIVSATITLSPTPLRANVGLVALFADRKNHVVCKVEVSQGHPEGLLALGDERDGLTTSLLASRDAIGLIEGRSYRVELRVPASLADTPITCAVSGDGIRRTKVTYRASDAGIAAYGTGTGQGLRIKIFDDEDDGRSAWDDFLVTVAE